MPESVEIKEQFGASLAQLEQFLGEGQEPAVALQNAARTLYAQNLARVSPIIASLAAPPIPGGVNPAAIQAARLDVELFPEQPLAGLYPLFQWGMEYGLCLITPGRSWFQPLFQKAESGLEPRVRDLRARGFEAFRARRWGEAYKLLTIFTQSQDEDCLVWRMIGFLGFCQERWEQSRAAYALAARLADKTVPIFAVECHLAAGFAARQAEEWELALNHDAQASRLASDLSFSHYEQGVAGFRLSLTQELLVPHLAHQTRVDATAALRRALRKDCRYAVRLECDQNFEKVRDHIQVLLQELHAEMAREASGALANIRTAIVNAEYDCTPERFGAIAQQPLEAGRLLADIYARNSILDFSDVIRQAPMIQTDLLTIRTLIRRVDERMQEIMLAFNMARQVVAATEWPQIGAGLEERVKQLRQRHSSKDLESYRTLEKEIPEARTSFYRFAAHRLKLMRGNIAQSLVMARSISQKLNQKASSHEARATKPPFRMEGGFLFWLLGFFVLRSGLPETVSIPATVLTVISAVISAIAIVVLYRFLARQRVLHSHASRREAALHDREIYQPLSHLLGQIDDCMELCTREKSFSIPTAARGYIGEKPGTK